jgi:carboxypeptidase family protein/TonB-dependent receptor-like protein
MKSTKQFRQICPEHWAQWLGVCLGVLLFCSPVFSQGNLGRITGTITDQSGGAIAGATVTVRDVQRGLSRTLTTVESGEYNAPNLLPGEYAVRAEAKGFKTVEQQKITLEVGKEIRVDLSLQPGEITQTITITEAPPMVETTNATLGGTLSNETINDLPLNGRNYINLLTLRPGMNVYAGGGSFTRSANGTRAEDIGYLLDGLRNDDSFTGSSVLNAAIPAGDDSTSLPIDAIQEFNTEQNPKAEFGWKPGAIVNAGIKSGTNSIHGTAFAFGRDTALDARNFFNAAPLPKAAIGLEQFGASLGGAIKKDKLFYFVNYEGQRYNVADSLIETPPTTITLGGDPTHSLLDACNVVAGNGSGGFNPIGTLNGVTALSAHIAGITIDPVKGCAIAPTNYTPGANESLFPTNPGSGNPNCPNCEILGMVSTSRQNNGVAKVDYHLNDHHSFSGTYFQGVGGGTWHDQAWEVGIPGSGNSPWLSQLWGYIQTGSGAWTWTPTSTLVNEFRVGYSHYYQPSVSNDSTVNPLAYGINTGVTDKRELGFPFIQINQLNGATFKLGGNWPKYNGPDGSLQILEHVSILRGKHAFKFGGEIIHDTSAPYVTMNAKGLIKFQTISDFLTGNVKNAGSAIFSGDSQRYLRDSSYAAFLQDDWRVTPKLMLNLGVRYELTTVLKDRDNLLGNFDPNSSTGFVQVGYGGVSSPFHGDHNNFSPRVGFAWDVRGDGKTVIRGGGSIMYEEIPLISLIAVGNQLGLNLVPAGATGTFFAGDLTGSPGTGTLTPWKGPGNPKMGAIVSGVSGGSLSTGWLNQNANPSCVTGSTSCGSIFPQTFVQPPLQCGDGLPLNPANPMGPANPPPCNTGAVYPNLRTPYISTWTLTIQRAITNNLSLEVAYVGNHGTKLLGFQDINQPPPGSSFPVGEVAWCNTNSGSAQTLNAMTTPYGCDPADAGGAGAVQTSRPKFSKFPYIGEIDLLSNQDSSNYNGLQVTLTQRPTRGLSFLAGYTYSHSFDAGSNNFNDIQLPPDSSHPTRGVYGQSLFDIRHRFTLSTTYAIPGIKRLGQLLQGWEINSVVTLQSASPWGVQDFTNDFSGTNQVNELNTFGQPWNFYGNDADFKAGRATPIPCWSGISTLPGGSALSGCTIASLPSTPNNPNGAPTACLNAATTIAAQNTLNNVGCYVAGNSVLIPPALGTVGNARRNIFPDLGFKNWDLSLLKETKIKERLTAQFRAEFFNVLNHANFSDPNGPANAGFNDPSTGNTGLFGCSCNTPDQTAPNPVLGTGGARSIQLGLKLIF